MAGATQDKIGHALCLRHRIAPEIHAQITSAQLTGQLAVHAANIEHVEAAGGKVRVRLSGGKQLDGDLVINATGPQTRFTAARSVCMILCSAS